MASYLDLPGTSGSASTPDAAALDITGDIEFRFDLSRDDNDTGSATIWLAKWVASGSQRSYRIFTSGSGFLIVNTSPNGGSASAVQTGGFDIGASGLFLNGDRAQWRLELDVDDGGGNRVLRTYSRQGLALADLLDDGNWTLHDTDTRAGTTSIFSSSSALSVGNGEDNNAYVARCRRAIVRSSIGGTVEFDSRFELEPAGTASFTESSGNAATVTVNANASIVGAPVVRRLEADVESLPTAARIAGALSR